MPPSEYICIISHSSWQVPTRFASWNRCHARARSVGLKLDQEPDSLQLITLYAIANQCPLEGGEAVYQARAMIQKANYDDEALCRAASQNSFESSRVDTPSYFSIFPMK